MPISQGDFMKSSEMILQGAAGEVCYRNSISRAYYALYHAALKHADSVSVVPLSAIRGGSHQKLSDFYMKGYNSKEHKLKLVRIGVNLLRLHGKRCVADYELGDIISPTDAEAHLISCKEIVELIGAISDKAQEA